MKTAAAAAAAAPSSSSPGGAKQQPPPSLARQNTPPPPPPPPPGYKARDATNNNNNSNNINNNAAATVNGTAHGSLTPDPAARAAHRERALHVWLNLVGTRVLLHLTDRTVVEGVFHTATPLPLARAEQRNKYVLKQVRVLERPPGETQTDIQPGSTVVVDMERVVQLHVKSLPKAATLMGAPKSGNNNSTATNNNNNDVSAFTDTEISGATAAATVTASKKELQEAGLAWTKAPPPSGPVLNPRAEALGGGVGGTSSSSNNNSNTQNTATFGSTAGLSGSIGGWDQFKANETLFNVKGTYDESIYTTQLNKKELSHSEIIKAERLAKEIEGTVSTNWHLAEERNQKVQGDYDEEDLYSGVLPAATKTAAPAPTSAPPSGTLSYAKVANKAVSEVKQTAEDKPKTAAAAAAVEPVKDTAKVAATAPPPKATDSKKEKPAEKEAPVLAEGQPTKAEATLPSDEPKKEAIGDESKGKPKLNPNAKEFTLNINAKSFTPKTGGDPQQQPPHPTPPDGVPVHLQQHPPPPPPQGGGSPYMGQPQPGKKD